MTVSGNHYEDDFGYCARKSGKTRAVFEEVLRRLSRHEAEAVEEACRKMLQQEGRNRCGVLVERVVPAFSSNFNDNTFVWTHSLSVTLSPDVPYGTIAYHTTTKE